MFKRGVSLGVPSYGFGLTVVQCSVSWLCQIPNDYHSGTHYLHWCLWMLGVFVFSLLLRRGDGGYYWRTHAKSFVGPSYALA